MIYPMNKEREINQEIVAFNRQVAKPYDKFSVFIFVSVIKVREAEEFIEKLWGKKR